MISLFVDLPPIVADFEKNGLIFDDFLELSIFMATFLLDILVPQKQYFKLV